MDKNVVEHVPLLLKMQEYSLAMESALKSNDFDLSKVNLNKIIALLIRLF